jgi:hypothetical protein
MSDARLHCGVVSHWFINSGVPTPYN